MAPRTQSFVIVSDCHPNVLGSFGHPSDLTSAAIANSGSASAKLYGYDVHNAL
jgi:hypothetical protein